MKWYGLLCPIYNTLCNQWLITEVFNNQIFIHTKTSLYCTLPMGEDKDNLGNIPQGHIAFMFVQKLTKKLIHTILVPVFLIWENEKNYRLQLLQLQESSLLITYWGTTCQQKHWIGACIHLCCNHFCWF